MRMPVDVRVKSPRITVDDIRQIVVETTDRAKQATLRHLIDTHRPFMAIIFCRTKRRVSTLAEALLAFGYQADQLHGDLSQAKREDVLKRFREAKLQLLVATDVAARGLDIDGVTHVFNYDIPLDAESYIHRIGRTGRAGGEGLAITLVAAKDRSYLELIEKGIQQSIERKIVKLAEKDRPLGQTTTSNSNRVKHHSRQTDKNRSTEDTYEQRRQQNIRRNAERKRSGKKR